MSKAIYKPKGKAGEYAEWACNLYVGCSNNCSYCYCKRGVLAHTMGGSTPKLKSCFKNERDAIKTFSEELIKNLPELRKSSLFFTFSSDPMIPETRKLNWECILHALDLNVRVQVLTKNAGFIHDSYLDIPWVMDLFSGFRKRIAFGFTLTGHDELEPEASSTAERIAAMSYLHSEGCKTFASLEPIVSPSATLEVFNKSLRYCDLFKVGLMSGVPKDYYNLEEVRKMSETIIESGKPVYLKKSLTDFLGWKSFEPVDVFEI